MNEEKPQCIIEEIVSALEYLEMRVARLEEIVSRKGSMVEGIGQNVVSQYNRTVHENG